MIEIRSAEEWAAAITTEIVPLGVRRIASGFHASVDRRDLGDDVRITRASAAASAIRRTARDITSSDDGFAIFQLNIAGAGRVSQGDRDCRLDGLSATVYTTDRPAGFEFSNGNDGYLATHGGTAAACVRSAPRIGSRGSVAVGLERSSCGHGYASRPAGVPAEVRRRGKRPKSLGAGLKIVRSLHYWGWA